MRLLSICAFALVCFTLGCQSKLPDSWKTTNNETINLKGKNKAFMWLAPDCPLCQTYSSEFIALNGSYNSEISFYGVIPGNHYNTNEISHFQDSFGFDLPILLDEHFSMTKHYKVKVTPEFLLVDANDKVLYRGKFDDWATDLGQKKIQPSEFYFKNALQAFRDGSPVSPSFVEPVGCIIEID